MSDQSWIIGVILVVVGSLGNNFGTNLVSLDHKLTEHKDNAEADQIKARNYSTNVDMEMASPPIIRGIRSESQETLIPQSSAASPKQQTIQLTSDKCSSDDTADPPKPKSASKCSFSLRSVGVLIFVTGNLLTFAAFGFAAQSLLAALESIQFVSNISWAHYIHHEHITNRMIIATVMIVAGNILVVIFSGHATSLYDSNAIIDIYLHNSAYHWYLIIAFLVWLSFHAIFLKYYNSRIFDKKLLSKHSFIEPFSFSVSSAIIGTQAVLQAKCMSMLIQVSARGNNQFNQATVYVILVAWLFFVIFWLRRLDLGLSLFPPLFIIPVLQVFFVFFAIICGGIFFQEFVGFGAGQWCGFVAGVSMILGGVYGLAPTDTKSVVVLPNIMADEVLQDVKEQIEEVPEVLSSIKHNMESSIRNIITPRGTMTPRGTGTGDSSMTPRSVAQQTIPKPAHTESSIRNKPVITSSRIPATTTSAIQSVPVPISSSVITTPRSSSRNNSSTMVYEISNSLKGAITAVIPTTITDTTPSSSNSNKSNNSNTITLSSLSLSSPAYQHLLQQPHPDMAEGDDKDAVTNENNSLRNSTSKSNFYYGNTSKSNIHNNNCSSNSNNSNNNTGSNSYIHYNNSSNIHNNNNNSSSSSSSSQHNNNNNNNSSNNSSSSSSFSAHPMENDDDTDEDTNIHVVKKCDEDEEKEKYDKQDDELLDQAVSSLSKTKRKPSDNMQLPPIGSANNSNSHHTNSNNNNVNNKIAVDNENHSILYSFSDSHII